VGRPLKGGCGGVLDKAVRRGVVGSWRTKRGKGGTTFPSSHSTKAQKTEISKWWGNNELWWRSEQEVQVQALKHEQE